MSTIKVDTVRPVTTDGSLTLQGDSSGSGVSGITIDSSGVADFPNGLTATGLILQSLNATVGNVDNTSTTTNKYVADVINQITIKSGNYVKITVHLNVKITGGASNALGSIYIHEGTVSSPSTELTTSGTVGDEQNTVASYVIVTLSVIDESPASTSPSYCFRINVDSGATSNILMVGTPVVILEEINA